MKFIVPIIALALGVSCSSLPKNYREASTRSLVRGDATPYSNVLIRQVDNGPILFVKSYTLGDKVWLEPGMHKVSVMCIHKTPWGQKMGGVDVIVNVEQSTEYVIKTKPMTITDQMPTAEVVKVE